MALNPSCNSVREGTRFPVLGDPPFPFDRAEVAKGEIRSVVSQGDLTLGGDIRTVEVFKKGTRGHQMAGSGMWIPYEGQENDTEEIKVTTVSAKAHGWEFRRAWYYWICSTKTNPIPQAKAEALNKEWGRQVRFDGYAGGKDADGPGDSYHVDTMEGLRALLAAITTQC
jgi:hypothetical protein